MKTYAEQWEAMFSDVQAQQANADKIERYYALETDAYDKILRDRPEKLSGKFADLQEELGFHGQPVIFIGFLDGIAPYLNPELDIAELDDDSELDHTIDYKELYLGMHKNKAKWLYELEAWENIFPKEELQQMTHDWRQSQMVRVEKIGRNDPCPCGSGKKYKKCCGRNV